MLRLSAAMAAGAAGIALLTLVAYGFAMEYHQDPDLMLTVIVVRMAAGFGVGLAFAVVFAVVSLIRRRSGIAAGFAKTSVLVASVTVVALAVFNLIEGS